VYLLVKYELIKNVTVVVVNIILIIIVVGLNIIPSHKHNFYIQCVVLGDWLNIKLCALKCKTGVLLQKISTAVGTNTVLSLFNVCGLKFSDLTNPSLVLIYNLVRLGVQSYQNSSERFGL
jgi:hypothetical protein